MNAVVIDLAEAVKAALNAASDAGTFTPRFAAQRAYVPIHDAETLDGIEVSVVARSIRLTMLARGSDQFDYMVDIGIQQRIGAGSMTPLEILEATDPLMLLVQGIADLFRGKPIAVGTGVLTCFAATNEPIYLPEHLDQFRVFTSVVSLTFRHARAR